LRRGSNLEGRLQIGGLGRLYGDITEDLNLKTDLLYRERIRAQRQIHKSVVADILSACHTHGVGGQIAELEHRIHYCAPRGIHHGYRNGATGPARLTPSERDRKQRENQNANPVEL
jgi:hypothetical protein